MKVTEVWRYPVKSMLGEKLDQAEVEPGGIQGDRQWAVVDAESGVSLSAKRYAELLSCRAWTIDGEIMIALPEPDGQRFVMLQLPDATSSQINVVLHWFEELKRLVPTN